MAVGWLASQSGLQPEQGVTATQPRNCHAPQILTAQTTHTYSDVFQLFAPRLVLLMVHFNVVEVQLANLTRQWHERRLGR